MSLPVEALLGGLVVTGLGGFLGHYLGGKDKVNVDSCKERRTSCNALLVEKIENLDSKIDTKFESLEKQLSLNYKHRD